MKVFIMAVLLDCVYQFLVFRWVYPIEAMVTAAILAILPYVAMRRAVNRIVHQVDRAKGLGSPMTPGASWPIQLCLDADPDAGRHHACADATIIPGH